MNNSQYDAKYCVTAIIDLQGFSSHLEIASYDVRTIIGQHAINRLKTLEEATQLLESERKLYPEYYPSKLEIKRINDALIIAIDLSEFLKPDVGKLKKTIYEEYSQKNLRKFYSPEEMKDDNLPEIHKRNILASIDELILYLGIISRVHHFINLTEIKNYFPGAKTIIATGFRKSFINSDGKEDYFSANFSLSNAFIATKYLKGSYLYVDNTILEIISKNQYALNVVKFAVPAIEETEFDPFEQNEYSGFKQTKATLLEPINVEILRRVFVFRRLNFLACILQILKKIDSYLSGETVPKNKDDIYNTISCIREGLSLEEIKQNKYKNYPFPWSRNIKENINRYFELLSTGSISELENKSLGYTEVKK
jgi:hypothetical protein